MPEYVVMDLMVAGLFVATIVLLGVVRILWKEIEQVKDDIAVLSDLLIVPVSESFIDGKTYQEARDDSRGMLPMFPEEFE